MESKRFGAAIRQDTCVDDAHQRSALGGHNRRRQYFSLETTEASSKGGLTNDALQVLLCLFGIESLQRSPFECGCWALSRPVTFVPHSSAVA